MIASGHLHFSPSSVFLYNIELIELVVFKLNSQWYTITAAAVIFKRNTLSGTVYS